MIRIAIDGPGGAGKSSVAKSVAKKLGIPYMDTGALYRTVGLFMKNAGVDTSDEDGVAARLPDVRLDLTFEDGKQKILLGGTDVGDRIRTQEISMAASDVSKIPAVRAFLLNTQKEFAAKNSVIMDGRDIGTVIIPDAEVKIFLTAKPEARAMRRFTELKERGIETTYEKVLAEMNERDLQDSTRAIAPCVPAEDSILLDNSDLTQEETIGAVLKIVKKVQKARKKRGSAFYMFFRYLLGPFVRFFCNIRVHGKENIPREGGCLICSNHIGIRDVLAIAAVFPRQVRFIAKKEWFQIPGFRLLIKGLGAISLDRTGNDVDALKNAVSTAKGGAPIVIFPQGHRYPAVPPTETPIKNGAGLIAYRAKVPVVPICLCPKDFKYGFMKRLDLYVGKTILYSEFGFEKGGFSEYKAATEKIFSEICELGGCGSYPHSDANDPAKEKSE